jgi:hypothetical protein
MLMEKLFASGIMTMGSSRADPGRQVGVFAPGKAEAAMRARAAELERFRWIAGEWTFENAVPGTPWSPPYSDIGRQKFAVSEADSWICSVAKDGTMQRAITFDPFSGQWIYVLLRGSFGMLRSKEGWLASEIAFTGLMTMVGVECEWRMTWTRMGDDRFRFVNEERGADGSWAYIDEWRFARV